MRSLVLFVFIAAAFGCAPPPQQVPPQAPPGTKPSAPATAPAAPSQTAPGTTHSAPPSGSDAGTSAATFVDPSQPVKEDQLKELRSAFDKNPSDATSKDALLDGLLKNANFYYENGQKGPGQYYPKALALFRQVKKIDPTNPDATAKIDTLEGIYRSMGRPIPNV